MVHGPGSAQQNRENGPAQSEPREALLLALDAARQELLAATTLIPAGERASRPVCGVWTVKELLGHIADWEWIGVEGLRLMAAGRPPTVEHIKDIETWNQTHARARHDQSWEVVWEDLNTIRSDLLQVLAQMSSSLLACSFPFPWGVEGTAYEWVSVFVRHDRDHAADLRAAGAGAARETEA